MEKKQIEQEECANEDEEGGEVEEEEKSKILKSSFTIEKSKTIQLQIVHADNCC